MQVNDRNRNRRNIGLLALIALVLQLGIAPAITIGQGHPNFAFVFAAVVALSIGGQTGVLVSFVAGLLVDLSSTGPIGLSALLFSIACYILGMEVRDRIAEEPSMTLIPFAVAALCVSLFYAIAMLLVGESESLLEAIVFRALPSTLLTILGYVPFLLIMGRAGGSGLRGGVTGKHRSRYTLGNR